MQRRCVWREGVIKAQGTATESSLEFDPAISRADRSDYDRQRQDGGCLRAAFRSRHREGASAGLCKRHQGGAPRRSCRHPPDDDGTGDARLHELSLSLSDLSS